MAQESIINIKINTSQAQKSLDGTSKSVRDVNNNTRNLQKEIKDLKREMQGLDVGSQKFNEIAKEAGKLQDQLDKVNQTTKNFASDTLVLDQTVGVVQGMAGAYGAVQGAMALAGVENEKLMEVMVRLQAIQAVTNGLQSVGVMINKASASGMLIRTTAQRVYNAILGQTNAATVTNTAVTTAQTTATGAATVATTALGTAMRALPIFALIGGIGMIVSALFDWGDATDDVAGGMDNINSKQLTMKQITKDVNDLIDTRTKMEVDSIQSTINSLETQLKLIDLKKEKTEEDIQKQLELKNEIIDLNNKILETQRAYEKIDLSRIVEDQKEAQRAMVEFAIELDSLLEQRENLRTFYKNDEKRRQQEVENINKVINAHHSLLESIQKEEKLRNDMAHTRFEDFQDELEFHEHTRALQKNLMYQTQVTEKKKEEFAKLKDEKILKSLTTNIDEQIKIIENYAEANKTFDDEVLKNWMKNSQTVQKQWQLDHQKLLLAEEERLRKEAKLQEYYNQQEIERRKLIVHEEERNANAIEKIRDLTSKRFLKGLDGEIQKFEDDYIKEREKLIDDATKRELKILEDQFLKLEISEANFVKKRAQILDRGVDNLLNAENAYLEGFRNYTDERIQLTIKEHNQREKLTKEQTDVILAEQVKLSTMQSMLVAERNAMLEAQEEVHNRKWYQKQLTEEEIFQEKMRGVRSDFLVERMNDEKQLLKEKLDVLEIEKQQALDNEELTQIERNKIVEDYNLKRQQLEEETSRTVYDLTKELNDDLQNESELGWLKTFAAIQLVGQQLMGLGNEIAKSFQIATQNSINSINHMYSETAEAFNQQLVNQEIGQEEFNDKMFLLEKNKEAEITKLKRQQFKRDQRNNKAQAIMSGAQAGAQAFVNPGFPLVYAILPLIAAQTAMAVNNISSQQFTANRGGIVPGSSNVNKDSVNASLTPGEAIINKNSTDMFLPLLSMMNQIGGGKTLDGTAMQASAPQKEKDVIIKTYVTTKDIDKGMKVDKRGRLNSRF